MGRRRSWSSRTVRRGRACLGNRGPASARWSGVTARLRKAGYTVDVPPNPLRGLASDSAYVASYLKSIQGPIILAGHSYGGAVITDAATGNPNVKALVYVDAYIPDTGDTILGLTSAKPGTTLDPTKAFNVVPFGSGAGEVDLYIKPSVFRADVAADESPHAAAILAAEQRPLAASALQEKSTTPAWKTIPSWALNVSLMPQAPAPAGVAACAGPRCVRRRADDSERAEGIRASGSRERNVRRG